MRLAESRLESGDGLAQSYRELLSRLLSLLGDRIRRRFTAICPRDIPRLSETGVPDGARILPDLPSKLLARTFIPGVSTSRQPKPSEQQVVDRVSKRRSEPVGQVRCCAFN